MTTPCKDCKFYHDKGSDLEIGPCSIVVKAYDETGFFNDANGLLMDSVYLDENLGCNHWKKSNKATSADAKKHG